MKATVTNPKTKLKITVTVVRPVIGAITKT